ncbi:VOC family protein [Nocardia sp. 2]|uniref:VOC family protein n=1 Tax=Nocardia acididurans TaxID=2802282 RepID=A0ABS1MDE7_9NOCA|nr:VOC family protein [Nocardia acididurans]MBL1078676.1 VOC family protein [Nocardia acididurans]
MPLLTRLGLPGDERAWAALGFTVGDGGFRIGQVACTIGEPAWGFDEVRADPAVLGVAALPDPNTPGVGAAGAGAGAAGTGSLGGTAESGAGAHANGVTFIDHVVYWVPDLDEAVTNLGAVLGIPPRRRFFPRGPEGPEMAFHRVGEPFIETVGAGLADPALVGVAFMTADLDAAVDTIRAAGGPIGDPKPAVQGGRIAGVWRGHLNWGIAFMEPEPGR